MLRWGTALVSELSMDAERLYSSSSPSQGKLGQSCGAAINRPEYLVGAYRVPNSVLNPRGSS